MNYNQLQLHIPYWSEDALEGLRAIYPDLVYTCKVHDSGPFAGRLSETLKLGVGRSTQAGDPLIAKILRGEVVDPKQVERRVVSGHSYDGSRPSGSFSMCKTVLTDEQFDIEMKVWIDSGLDQALREDNERYKNPPARLYRQSKHYFWQRHLPLEAKNVMREIVLLPDGLVEVTAAAAAPWWAGTFKGSWKRAGRAIPRGFASQVEAIS